MTKKEPLTLLLETDGVAEGVGVGVGVGIVGAVEVPTIAPILDAVVVNAVHPVNTLILASV